MKKLVLVSAVLLATSQLTSCLQLCLACCAGGGGSSTVQAAPSPDGEALPELAPTLQTRTTVAAVSH